MSIIFTFSDSTTKTYTAVDIFDICLNTTPAIYDNRPNDVVSVYISGNYDIPLYTNNPNLSNASDVDSKYLLNGLLFSKMINLVSITTDPANTYFTSVDGCLFSKDGTKLYTYPAGKTGSSYTIPSIVTEIWPLAFMNTVNLQTVIFNTTMTLSPKSAQFANASGLTSMIIPPNITIITTNLFYNCVNLASLTLHNKLEAVFSKCIEKCSSLTSLTIPTNIDNRSITLYASCFRGATGLVSITLPNKITIYGDAFGYYIFYGCSSLTSIVFPDSVTVIPRQCFYNCISLTSVTLPNTITSINYAAFSLCRSLTSITIPSSVTVIPEMCFYNCISLPSVTLPNTITSINSLAFSLCRSLTSITIPSSVTSLDASGFNFALCTNLETVIFNTDKIPSFPVGLFAGCYKLSSITIPNGVTSLGNICFSGTALLRSITIPDSIISISSSAFNSSTVIDASGNLIPGQTIAAGLTTVYMTPVILERFRLSPGLNATFFGASNVTIILTGRISRIRPPPRGYIFSGPSVFTNNLVFYKSGTVSGNTHSGVSNSRVVRRRT
jgi:hypothetical protein